MIKAEIDFNEWNRTFKEYMRYTKKTAAEALNTKMVFILQGAIKNTKKANAAAIRQSLNAGSPPTKENIVAKAALNHGEHISQKEIKQRAKRLLASRVRSIGFILSGWIPALRKTLPYSERKSAIVPRQRGKDKGGAKPAPLLGQTYATAEAWNSVEGGPPSGKVHQVKIQGLQAAFSKEIASMVQYIEKKWQQGGRKYFA